MWTQNIKSSKLCSGSVRQLNNQITARRNVRFYAFALVSAQDVDMHNSRAYQMQWLKSQGFEVVEYRMVTGETLDEQWIIFLMQLRTMIFPSDGLVALYDDIAYGRFAWKHSKIPAKCFCL